MWRHIPRTKHLLRVTGRAAAALSPAASAALDGLVWRGQLSLRHALNFVFPIISALVIDSFRCAVPSERITHSPMGCRLPSPGDGPHWGVAGVQAVLMAEDAPCCSCLSVRVYEAAAPGEVEGRSANWGFFGHVAYLGHPPLVSAVHSPRSTSAMATGASYRVL